MLDASYLNTILAYDPLTGALSNKIDRKRAKAGFVHRAIMGNGYIGIRLEGRLWKAQDVIWCMMTGTWPDLTVDHEDHEKTNNRWANLRLATRWQNRANSRVNRNHKLGIKGVSKVGNRYKANIRVAGQLIYLGRYDTAEEASEAYQEAAEIAFGEFACAG
jgi:hypothetical protein